MTVQPYVVPVSIKGIVFEDNKVWLRHNERDEWELPGGKLDKGEQPEETVIRELREELGFDVRVADLIQSHVYTVRTANGENREIIVVSYLCKIINRVGEFEHVGEAGTAQFELFSAEDIDELNMPEFYKLAIQKAWKLILEPDYVYQKHSPISSTLELNGI